MCIIQEEECMIHIRGSGLDGLMYSLCVSIVVKYSAWVLDSSVRVSGSCFPRYEPVTAIRHACADLKHVPHPELIETREFIGYMGLSVPRNLWIWKWLLHCACPQAKFTMYHAKTAKDLKNQNEERQECIPVGCVLPALYRTGGSPWTETPGQMDRDLPGQMDRDPPDRDPLPPGQTNASENITLSKTSFAGGKNREVYCCSLSDEIKRFDTWKLVRVSAGSKCNETTASNSNSLTNSTYTDSWMEIQKATNHKCTRISFTAMGIPLVTIDVVSVWELN